MDISKGKYWDASCNPIVVNECHCEVGKNCWAHKMANRYGWKSGWYPERLKKISTKGKAKVFAMCWLGDIAKTEVPDYQIKAGLLAECQYINIRRQNLNIEPHTFLFLTKWPKLVYEHFEWLTRNIQFKHNQSGIWIGTTITGANPKLDKKRVNSLLKFKGFRKWLSIEPLLAPINSDSLLKLGKFDQVVIGVDSAPGAKKTDWIWAYDTMLLCRDEVPCFVKQLHINGKLSKNMNDWPKDLQVRELEWNNDR